MVPDFVEASHVAAAVEHFSQVDMESMEFQLCEDDLRLLKVDRTTQIELWRGRRSRESRWPGLRSLSFGKSEGPSSETPNCEAPARAAHMPGM